MGLLDHKTVTKWITKGSSSLELFRTVVAHAMVME